MENNNDHFKRDLASRREILSIIGKYIVKKSISETDAYKLFKQFLLIKIVSYNCTNTVEIYSKYNKNAYIFNRLFFSRYVENVVSELLSYYKATLIHRVNENRKDSILITIL